jgi:hypothetical protein
MATSGGPNIVKDGLVLHLDAGSHKSYPGSGTTWYDLSTPNSYAVSYNSPTFNSNGYFNFDGASDYFRLTRSDLSAGTFSYDVMTCELWYKPTSSGSGGGTNNNLITIENTVEISVGNNGNGYHQLYYASNPWAWYGTSGDVLKNDVWNLITFVHDSVGRWFYVNGNQVFYRGDSGNLSAGSGSYPYLTLMGRFTGTGSQAEGDLSSVKLYNKVLTETEILQNYNATKSRFNL